MICYFSYNGKEKEILNLVSIFSPVLTKIKKLMYQVRWFQISLRSFKAYGRNRQTIRHTDVIFNAQVNTKSPRVSITNVSKYENWSYNLKQN